MKRWRDVQRRATLIGALEDKPGHDESLVQLLAGEEEEDEGAKPGEEEGDDALRRMLVNRAMWGNPSADTRAEWARIAQAESSRWAELMPRTPGSQAQAAALIEKKAPVSGTNWVNLGPTDAAFQYNSAQYLEVDSGRINDIRVHPLDPAIVYVATSGGGIWKTFNFGVTNPTWFPVTEGFGNLAIGALDMDPSAPDTLYAGLGDPFDVSGGQVLKTTDGGITWGAPVSLSGTYPSGLAVTATRIREIKVDPANPNLVLVGTDVGLFRSVNGGASFALVDLPNTSGALLAESVWSIVWTGQVNGVSRFAASGVTASAVGARPPGAGAGTATTPGDIWTSINAGAGWSSRLAAGALPAVQAGRITLAAGTPSSANPPVTVVYAQVGSRVESPSSQVGVWRSTDSGDTFVAATGTVANPTIAGGASYCSTMNVAGGQAWYNQALAVDPADSNRVFMAGVYCSVRTRNGLSGSPVWENTSHWLPAPSLAIGNTANGTLPYAHADWHTALIVRVGSGYRVFGGNDGGIFVSSNVFDPNVINDTTVTWAFPNRGIVTHLAYSVASGDPADGNPFIAYMGLQDNGTRFRDSPAKPTTFNQVVGGDGLGAAVQSGGTPLKTVYWGSVNGRQRICNPLVANCNTGEGWNYQLLPTRTCTGDTAGTPFVVRYAPVPTYPNDAALLTYTSKQVFRVVGDPFFEGTANWVAISPCLPSTVAALQGLLTASPNIDGLYGIPTAGGRYYITSNCQAGNNACTWTLAGSAQGFDANGDGTIPNSERMTGSASITFPPTTPAGKNPGDVYLVSSVAVVAGDGVSPIGPALGRVFITQDRGVTWGPFHGNGTGFDLPNVPTSVIKYDPGDLTNNTLYAGTDLGVYRSTDGGQTWRRFGAGMPMVKVTDLFISKAGNLMRAATYGRGLWEIYPAATDKGVNGNGDFDRNQQIDFADVSALSSRLGTTPAGTAAPYYEWNLDLVGNTNAVDESDLSQLLTRFGGRP